MKIGRKMTAAYFDLVYNRLYDFTTARLAAYRRLQSACLDKLRFDDGDKVLCAGVGTGNEIISILGVNSKVSIVGVDYSDTALRRAYKKALAWGKEIEVLTMDVQNLEFTSGSFDQVLCLHVMDFVEDKRKTTAEILRVLTRGGQFVITYPSHGEGLGLGMKLLRDYIRRTRRCRRHQTTTLLKSLAQTLVGFVYLPLLFRPKRKSYSLSELKEMISELTAGDFQIEEYTLYNDFIVYGKK